MFGLSNETQIPDRFCNGLHRIKYAGLKHAAIPVQGSAVGLSAPSRRFLIGDILSPAINLYSGINSGPVTRGDPRETAGLTSFFSFNFAVASFQSAETRVYFILNSRAAHSMDPFGLMRWGSESELFELAFG